MPALALRAGRLVPRPNVASGPVEDAAQELADIAFPIFEAKAREALPGIVADTIAADGDQLRNLAADAIKQALADQPIDARIEAAKGQLVRGLIFTAVGAAVGAAFLTTVMQRLTR